MRRMVLLTKEVLRALPPIGTHADKDPKDVPVPVKFFDPCGRGTWYVTELDPDPESGLLAFCYCVSPLGPDCDELGYTSIQELSEVKGALGIGIERDRGWNPRTTLAEVISGAVR